MGNRFIIIVLFFLSLFRLAHAELILGVHPYLDAETIIERFQPLAEYLSMQLDTDVEVRVGRNYESHLQAVGRDKIDIAFLGPATYIKLVNEYGQKPLLARLQANNKATFHGHIIVRNDSHLTAIQDLKNHHFAFGDKNSTMSSLVPRALLLRNGITLNQLAGYRYLKGHKNVAIAVLAGDADAGAIKAEVYQQFSHRGLKSLAQTPEISEHVFVTRSNMPVALQEQIRDILLGINSDLMINKTLKPIKKQITGLATVVDADYDSLRDLMSLINEQDFAK